jgi:hypothetical protein
VLWLTLWLRASSRTGSPLRSPRRIASRFWCSVNFGFRPSLAPRALARSRPSLARVRIKSLRTRPARLAGKHQAAVCCRGVGPCIAERTETGFLGGDCGDRSRVDRASRSIRVTVSTSPASSWSSTRRSCARLALLRSPLHGTRCPPCVSATRLPGRVTLWPSIETRA